MNIAPNEFHDLDLNFGSMTKIVKANTNEEINYGKRPFQSISGIMADRFDPALKRAKPLSPPRFGKFVDIKARLKTLGAK